MSNLPINSPIRGPGLTKPGVVILQFLVIFFLQAIELFFRSSLGIITALAIWIAFFGAIYLGRGGTLYVAAVSPPISLLICSLLLMPTVGGGSIAPTKFLVDLVSGLASISFYLLSGAAITWFLWFKKERNTLS
ncbi:MAG: hypothetical protein EBV37_01515 [Actinobacteria bacterium]|nr:hypothetical protein [Actinomycetota bacterium]NCA25562.1 hypothetical protein [Actinomycetota bacterium]NCU77730.1 hypothetical protein [Actinomycetota bacterium]NCU96547.1 hypothetical protein [Actinomycetota bacterium]NCZ76542.1 hypothetical protein [Actinomycetota bacterium]